MEFTVQKQQITIHELAAHLAVEQPVQTDVLLPDYCADIVKVLKCEAQPQIMLARMELDKLVVEGMMQLSVFYMSAEKKICKAEFKTPFSRNIDGKASPGAPLIDIDCRPDYVTCRATSPRRLEIRASATLDIRISDEKQIETVAQADGCGIQLKKDLLQASRVAHFAEKQFSVSEDLDASCCENGISEILRATVTTRLTDQKVIAGKVILKGEALIHLLYNDATPACRCATMDYALPVSQILSVDGIDDSCRCFAELTVFSADLHLREKDANAPQLLACDLMLECRARAFRDTPLLLASDCYSTRYETEFSTGSATILCLEEIAEETAVQNGSLSLPEGVTEVIDVTATPLFLQMQVENRRAVVRGTLAVHLLAYAGEEPVSLEKNEPFTFETGITTDSSDLLFFPSLSALSVSHSLREENRCDIRCEIGVRGCAYRSRRLDVITGITVLESARRQPCTDAGMVVYFADRGESMWEIAKHYNTSIDRIMEENDLTEDLLGQNAMLIIPIVQ